MSSPNLPLNIYIHTKKKRQHFFNLSILHPKTPCRSARLWKKKASEGKTEPLSPRKGRVRRHTSDNGTPASCRCREERKEPWAMEERMGGFWHWMVYESAYNEYTTVYI